MKHMPFFKNITAYRLSPDFCKAALEGATWWDDLPVFEESEYPVPVNFGFILPCEAASEVAYSTAADSFAAITLRIQTRPVSPKAIAQATQSRARQIEQLQGYKPGRKQMKEIKEDTSIELQRKAPPVYRDTRAILDFAARWLYVDSCTDARLDEFVGVLSKYIVPLPLSWVHTRMSPVSIMTGWAGDGDCDSDHFSVDNSCTFKSPYAAQAAYSNLTLDRNNAQDHIRAGMTCVRLALTWRDRVSFVLGETMRLRSVKPLDIQFNTLDDEESDFDSDMFLFAATMGDLMDDLIEALDGEHESDDPADDL